MIHIKKNSFGTGIVVVVIFIAVLGLVGMALDESEPKCIKSGCDNEQASGSSYCYLHKPSSYSGGSTGSTSGYQSKNSFSASFGSGSTSDNESDTCHHGSCKKEVIRGSRYCASHTCGKGRSGCYREVVGANELCSSCKAKKKNQSSNSSRSNSSNSYSSSSGSSKSSKPYKRDTYDDGYEAVYDDDDYDMDRYYKDDDYARGVDGAMGDLEDIKMKEDEFYQMMQEFRIACKRMKS